VLLSAAVLALVNFRGSQIVPVVLVASIAFMMIGPYSYLAGAISLDFGGKQGSGTASGLIDGAGNLGGVLAGNSFARVSVMWGWKGAFAALAIVALLSSTAAGFYLNHLKRSES
jgi:sugar phosphate permease